MDHTLFITAVVLNPFIKRKLFTHQLSSLTLVSIIEKLYCRVFELSVAPPELGLSQRALNYVSATQNGDVFGYSGGEWTEERLKEMIPVSTANLFHFLDHSPFGICFYK